MECPLLLCLAALLFMSGVATVPTTHILSTPPELTLGLKTTALPELPPPGLHIPDTFYPFWNGTEVDLFANNGTSSPIALQQAFRYFGSYEYTIYVSKNGVLSFSEPPPDFSPEPYEGADIIAPLWTDFKIDYSEKVIYKEVTSGSLLSKAAKDINTMFSENNFYPRWLFIATWEKMSFANKTGNATFQAVLVSNGTDASYIMLNYGQIDSTDQYWRAGYEAVNGNYSFIPEADIVRLSSTSNVQIPGRWAFRVAAPGVVTPVVPVPSTCQMLNCTWDEVCRPIHGTYGCACGYNNSRPNKDTYDAAETCSGSTGSLSLSRCQLFEAGYSAAVLHLNDQSCKGKVHNNRLVFNFDSNANMCGTTLENNATHIIFKNNVGTTDGIGVISRTGGLNIAFSCVYPLIQSISMPMAFQATGSVISKELSTEGTYQIRMIPYPDSQFMVPYSGSVTLQTNQQLYIAVEVDQFDSNQIALVLDKCWATPVDQVDYNIRWDLIINECPNPADGTVVVLQNGVSTSSRFSFRMFTFTSFNSNIYLHCQVHLCLLSSANCAPSCNGEHNRRRRSVEFYDSAAITMGF